MCFAVQPYTRAITARRGKRVWEEGWPLEKGDLAVSALPAIPAVSVLSDTTATGMHFPKAYSPEPTPPDASTEDVGQLPFPSTRLAASKAEFARLSLHGFAYRLSSTRRLPLGREFAK